MRDSQESESPVRNQPMKKGPQAVIALRRRVTDLESQVKTLEQTVSLQNKKHEHELHKLKKAHRNELGQYVTNQSHPVYTSSGHNTTSEDQLTAERKKSSKETLSVSGNLKIDVSGKSSIRASPRTSNRSKRRGESISTTKAFHEFVEYSKNTPLNELKDAFVSAKIREGVSNEEAKALFEDKAGQENELTDLIEQMNQSSLKKTYIDTQLEQGISLQQAEASFDARKDDPALLEEVRELVKTQDLIEQESMERGGDMQADASSDSE